MGCTRCNKCYKEGYFKVTGAPWVGIVYQQGFLQELVSELER